MLEAVNISKIFNGKSVINNFSFKIQAGDLIAITGVSGSGKTTLLNIMGLLEKPTSGHIIVDGITSPSKRQTMLAQRNLFGYIFQNFGLIENETVSDNLSISFAYTQKRNKREEIKSALSNVNLEGFENKKIYELSGGEQQRVALARVFLKNCVYIFADEPTGNLDIVNRDIVFDILKKLNDSGKTIIFATHDMDLASRGNIHISL